MRGDYADVVGVFVVEKDVGRCYLLGGEGGEYVKLLCLGVYFGGIYRGECEFTGLFRVRGEISGPGKFSGSCIISMLITSS